MTADDQPKPAMTVAPIARYDCCGMPKGGPHGERCLVTFQQLRTPCMSCCGGCHCLDRSPYGHGWGGR